MSSKKMVWISSENNVIHSEMPSLGMRQVARTSTYQSLDEVWMI